MKIKLFSIATFLVVATPIQAREVQISPNVFAVTLQDFDAQPATDAAANIAALKIERAALTACGASASALKELQRAVRRSACWRKSMTDAREQINSPLLIQALKKRWAG